MAVLVSVAVLAIEGDAHATGGLDAGKDPVQAGTDVSEAGCLGEIEIQILGESVIGEPASAQSGTALEGKHVAQPMAREADQEPREAVVPLDDRLGDAPPGQQ